MGEDDRLKYLEELMQPHIPLKELKEIRQEIEDIKTAWQERIWLFTTNDCFDRVLEIIDKHIKEIEDEDNTSAR